MQIQEGSSVSITFFNITDSIKKSRLLSPPSHTINLMFSFADTLLILSTGSLVFIFISLIKYISK